MNMKCNARERHKNITIYKKQEQLKTSKTNLLVQQSGICHTGWPKKVINHYQLSKNCVKSY